MEPKYTLQLATPTANASDPDDALDKKIQNLPQELQDLVRELYQTSQLPDTTVIIENSYRPPVTLQLSSKISGKFAARFYGETVFEMAEAFGSKRSFFEPYGLKRESQKPVFHDWVTTLSKPHLAMLRTIHCTSTRGAVFGGQSRRERRLRVVRHLRSMLDYGILDGVLQHVTLQVTFTPDGEDAETFSVEGNMPDTHFMVPDRPVSRDHVFCNFLKILC